MKKILLILCLLFSAHHCLAATYFVDYTGGDDTNNGTSSSTPFQHCPGDPRAASNANITLSAGDIIVFEGGVTYAFASGDSDSQIAANASGSSGNVITYRSGHIHDTPWGTGRAVIDGANSNLDYGSYSGVLDLGSYSYITVEGFEFVNQPENGDVSEAMISWTGSTGGNIIVDNCYLHYTNGAAILVTGDFDGSTTPSGFTIQNSTLENSFAHLVTFRWEVDDINILNNTFDLAGNDPYSAGTPLANCINFSYDASGGAGSEQTNITIRGNTLSDTCASKNKGLILFQENIDTATVEDNTFNCTTATGCLNFAGPIDNLIIRNNVFHDGPSTHGGLLRFRNGQGADGAMLSDNIDILNNTFVGSVDAEGSGIIFFHVGTETDDTIFTNVDIRNNVIDTDAGTSGYCIYIDENDAGTGPIVQLASLTCDYNAFQNLNSSSDYFYYRTAGRTFAEWKTDISDDANSNFGQVSFADEANDDFQLTSGDTVVLDQGVDLSGQGYSDDKNGTSRPQGAAWDIGAYEFLGASQSGVISSGEIR